MVGIGISKGGNSGHDLLPAAKAFRSSSLATAALLGNTGFRSCNCVCEREKMVNQAKQNSEGKEKN